MANQRLILKLLKEELLKQCCICYAKAFQFPHVSLGHQHNAVGPKKKQLPKKSTQGISEHHDILQIVLIIEYF